MADPKMIYVKPSRPGLLVRLWPAMRYIPDDGRWVEPTGYIMRRLRVNPRSGAADLVECKPPSKVNEKPVKAIEDKAKSKGKAKGKKG